MFRLVTSYLVDLWIGLVNGLEFNQVRRVVVEKVNFVPSNQRSVYAQELLLFGKCIPTQHYSGSGADFGFSSKTFPQLTVCESKTRL